MQTPSHWARKLASLPRLAARRFKSHVIRKRLNALQAELTELQKHMAIDAVLAEQHHAHYVRNPTLTARRLADKLLALHLEQQIRALQAALNTLERGA